MNPSGSSRWSRILYPCLGHRILDGPSWRGRHFPLVTWFYYASTAWVAPRLIALVFIGFMPTIGLLLFGSNNPAVHLSFAIAGLIVTGLIITGFLRPKLHVQSHLPARVAAGGPFTIRYTVHNHGRLPAHDVEIDSLPFPYILELRSRPASLQYLAGGDACTVTGGGRALKRGRYLLQPMRWDSDFPFGLWRWGKTDWSDRVLNVYPAHARLQSLSIPAGVRRGQETHVASHLTREALEFHGCREFRAGDLVRHIHPRSSARLGIPVVKEFKAEGRGRTALVVDTWRQSRWTGRDMLRDTVVEAALSLSASIVDYLARTDRVLELLIAGPGLYDFESAGRTSYADEIMDILAGVEPCREDPLPRWAPRLLEEAREIQSVILILGRWDLARAAFVQDLQSTGVGLKLVLVEGRRRKVDIPEMPHDMIRLAAKRILNGEVVAL